MCLKEKLLCMYVKSDDFLGEICSFHGIVFSSGGFGRGSRHLHGICMALVLALALALAYGELFQLASCRKEFFWGGFFFKKVEKKGGRVGGKKAKQNNDDVVTYQRLNL